MTEYTPLWEPSETRKQHSALWDFARHTKSLHGLEADDYAGLHRWSVDCPAEFYAVLWDYLAIVGDKGDSCYISDSNLRQTKFYPQARLNYAENLLQHADERLAIIAHREDGTRRSLTRQQLYDQVSRVVQAMKAEGIGEGDRVAAIISNDLEAIICYLATSAIGAIWSSCSPDFGPAGASDRLCQVEPKLLFAVSSYSDAGRHIDITSTIQAVAHCSEVTRIVVIDDTLPVSLQDLPTLGFDDWLAPFSPEEIEFKRLPFDAPMVILFSSGTTGKPKCITHSGAGLLLQHKKEQLLHCDIRSGERFFYYTTCGWMMWNWQVSGLALDACLVTYAGNALHPNSARLVDLIDAEDIAIFGTSAKHIYACEKTRLKPRESHTLDKLKLITSTGSPLLPTSFDYIYHDWKADVHLASISGGTDICGCFLGGNPVLPVYRGELQCAMLGMDVDTLDPDGNPVSGEPGELVCRNAHLSMPVCFWNDPDGSRYHDAYFARFPGVWAHGDFVEKRPSGGFVIHGRSDTTLNPGGVRIGTAEIYRQVETIEAVEECIAVGQEWKGDQRVILFVRLRPGEVLSNGLVKLIKNRIREGTTARHVPARVIEVTAIPRTRSGKISEIAVRDILHGREINNTTALANPESLEQYRQYAV